MRKISSILLMSILICCIVILPCSAHSGRTDSNGGHYYGNGQYHYHHGYSAHQHYDMDNDGDLDCPKTSDITEDYNYSGNTEKEEESDEESKGRYTAYIVISLIVLMILLIALLIYRSDSKVYKNSYLDEQKKSNELINKLKDIDSLVEKERAEWENKCKSYEDKIDFQSEDIRLYKEENEFLERKIAVLEKYSKPAINLIDVPKDSTIGVDHFPKEKRVKYEWGNKYTFFVSKNYKYHKSSCNCVKYCTPMNAYEIKQDGYSPCSKCKPILPDMEWVDKYFEIIKERQDNDIFFEFDINPQ